MKSIERLIIEQITKPTSRGQQVKLGPSEVGGCALCVGETLALRLPELYPDIRHTESFGLASWAGTAVHAYLDETLEIPNAIKEQKNDIFELEGYGIIRGSTDLFSPDHKRVIDYKYVGKWSYDKMRLQYLEEPAKIPSVPYRTQQMLYGWGWKQLGYKVEAVSLCVIPKLSNKVEDIRFFTEQYNQEVVDKSIARLELIWQYVQEGRLAELPMDDECYTCTRVLMRN